MLTREKLVAYRSAQLTPDTAERLRRLEARAASLGDMKVVFEPDPGPGWEKVVASPGPSGLPPTLSLRPAGREVRMRIRLPTHPGSEDARRQTEVETLWSLAIPLGFVPWTRYPLPGHGDDLFHCLGPWQMLYDSLCGEGRGELAWPSVCAAAQVDVGRWEADRHLERFVQAQVHRLGIPVGPIDGIVTERLQEAIRALGLGGLALKDVARALAGMETPEPSQAERRIGHVIVPGNVVAMSHGRVAATRTRNGFALTIDGPGRVILDIDSGT